MTVVLRCRTRTANLEQRILILVADDSEDNQFLLQEYCRGSSYNPTFVEDGERAVAAFRAGSFEIVVMDLQMPVMDGLEATRLIRRVEADRGGKRTPILALTAHVSPADVAATRAAGCDVHIGKPVSMRDFLAALDCWKSSPVLGVRPLVRIEIQPGMEQLALSYFRARQCEIEMLQDLWRRSAFVELRRLGHNMKGTGTGYGFPDISRIGGAIELAATEGDLGDLSAHVTALANYLEAASLQMGVEATLELSPVSHAVLRAFYKNQFPP